MEINARTRVHAHIPTSLATTVANNSSSVRRLELRAEAKGNGDVLVPNLVGVHLLDFPR